MAKPREFTPDFVDDAREASSRTYEVRDPAPPDMVEMILAHIKSILPRMGQGTPAQKAAGRAQHRAWLVEMARRFPAIGWGEEVLAWDRWVARRYAIQPAELALAADLEEPAWIREGA